MNQPMDNLQDRLNYAMKRRGVTAAALARAVDATEASVSLWVNGPTKSIQAKFHEKLVSALRCNLLWLLAGKGPSGIDEPDGGGEDGGPVMTLSELSSEELELVSYYRGSSNQQKDGILGAAYGIAHRRPAKGKRATATTADEEAFGVRH